ncbi:outer membrane beta-barrel protein [uncultured Algibacter sp.]|uniref:outer membrane beta-barrel protein n=1 Tax=uncultured Algibacter sp. TaxID=298659 RepID=UPI00260FE00E|nr:outer membrane beta-barrel protein [uncultured Algibacter sp.]
MSEKKHIDRLFQEKFKDFEATPNDKVWDNIEAKLKEKKKRRRVIPIWWRYAGIAALLLLLITVGSLYFNETGNSPVNNNPENQVVDEKTDNTLEKNTRNTNSNNTPIVEENEINNASKSNIIIADTKEEQKDVDSNNGANLIKSSNNSKTASKTVIAKVSEANKANALIKEQKLNEVISKNNNGIAKNSEIHTNPELDPAKSESNNNVLIDKDQTDKLLNDIKNDPNTAIAQEENSDSESMVDSKKENKEITIEEALEKTKNIIEEEKLNRWSVAPNAAPVFFNSLGEGSSIDPQFNTNSKSGELNMSYGIKGSYAVNNRLSIRSGVNKVTLGYSTNNVIAFQSIGFNSEANSLQNISADKSISTSNNISLISGANINAKSSGSTLLSSATNTSINQEFGYIEIPLEIQYAISNKKLGINVIGGFSSFFLNENKIYSESSGSKTLIGEANNINKISYSANFGLGINYEVSKKLDLNLEPIFKYQINTFSNTSGDFTPYFIGVYTGIAIKF